MIRGNPCYSCKTRPGAIRPGFALPLALMVLVVAAMLVSLLLDSGVQELRTARGELAAARAGAAAESALADLLAGPPDSGFAGLARGAAIQSVTAAGADTVRLTLQSLGGALARVVIRSRSWSGGIRADAGVLAYLIVTPGPNPPGSARFTRLPGWWWAAFP